MRHIRILIYDGEEEWLKSTLNKSLRLGSMCTGANNYITVYSIPMDTTLEDDLNELLLSIEDNQNG